MIFGFHNNSSIKLILYNNPPICSFIVLADDTLAAKFHILGQAESLSLCSLPPRRSPHLDYYYPRLHVAGENDTGGSDREQRISNRRPKRGGQQPPLPMDVRGFQSR
jgi:hypothetical protein